jgi:acetoin utilization deacetylase AcuC-like enzyme
MVDARSWAPSFEGAPWSLVGNHSTYMKTCVNQGPPLALEAVHGGMISGREGLRSGTRWRSAWQPPYHSANADKTKGAGACTLSGIEALQVRLTRD